MYFGGIWGGQLQRWRNGTFNGDGESPVAYLPAKNEPALCAKVARLTNDLLEFAEAPKDVMIIDENGNPLLQGITTDVFLKQAGCISIMANIISLIPPVIHIIYVMPLVIILTDRLLMPGRILEPVVGWTSHHSICEFNGKWYLFYHDSSFV